MMRGMVKKTQPGSHSERAGLLFQSGYSQCDIPSGKPPHTCEGEVEGEVKSKPEV